MDCCLSHALSLGWTLTCAEAAPQQLRRLIPGQLSEKAKGKKCTTETVDRKARLCLG